MKKRLNDFLYEDLSYKIRGCAFRVYNELGFGHKENVYQKALELEFIKAELSFEKECSLPITYKEKRVGFYRPDFVINHKIIVEVKAVPIMPKSHETQLTYYLKSTNFKLGFSINFGATTLDIRRRVWTAYYLR